MNNSEQICERKLGHKILLIGKDLCYSQIQNEITREDAEISYFPSEKFNEIRDLTDYNLCILGCDSFLNESHYREIFCKQLFRAIKSGVTICVVYYNESLSSNSIGVRISKELKLSTPSKLQKVIHDEKATQKEFHSFIERWGSSMVGFAKVREGEKVICKTEKAVLGFSAKVEKSQIIYLPFCRNVLDKNELKEGFQSLIDSLLTFISVSQTDIPFWAKENPFFTEEKSLLKEKEVLQKKLAEKVTELEIFDKAKSLLFCREYTLENFLINFLISELDLKIYRKETFDADFWLVDKNDEKIAIAEIKSAVKGFKKAMIYKLLNHRHDYEKPDDFPSLLFVNCNLQAGKWSDKDRPINAEDYREAARNNGFSYSRRRCG